MVCKLCNRDFKSLGGLHGHLSKCHKISQEEFYHSFYPRYDLRDKELIVYKDYKQYHEDDFNSRESFAYWLSETVNDPKTQEYCWNKVKERMTRKMVTTLPSQVELKSIFLPSISGFEKICGSMENFMAQAKLHGVNLKFDYSTIPVLDYSKPVRIFCDTREQRPLHYNGEMIKMKLSVGDYACDDPYYSDVFIERKSISDLAGTLTKGKERFEEEIARANELGFYLVVLVEDSYSDVLNYSPVSSFAKKVTGKHLFYSIRELMNKYSNLQFVMSGSRTRASDLMEKIFRLKSQVRQLDLEWAKDSKYI